MTRTYFDDFTKLPLSKMVQSISDMTFLYKETKVPKEHYKKLLSKDYVEMVEANVSVKLVETIYNIISGLKKESPRLFYQALILLDTGIKPSSMTAEQFQALTVTTDQHEQNKKAHILDKQAHETFDDILKNGVTYFADNND